MSCLQLFLEARLRNSSRHAVNLVADLIPVPFSCPCSTSFSKKKTTRNMCLLNDIIFSAVPPSINIHSRSRHRNPRPSNSIRAGTTCSIRKSPKVGDYSPSRRRHPFEVRPPPPSYLVQVQAIV